MNRFKQFISKILLSLLVIISTFADGYSAPLRKIELAKDQKTRFCIVLSDSPSSATQFAASELAKYLHHISGATFKIVSDYIPGPAIVIKYDKEKEEENYTIEVRKQYIFLTGGSERAILYAVYDLLERLGCRWLAPEFSFYNGLAEFVPNKSDLVYEFPPNPISEHPQFKYRKIDIEEGLSHNIENLKQIIDWMPKLRFNTFMVPLDYGGSGRVQWDKWRKELTPELKKRGLLIEVGGHGYQNFLSDKMENNTLFNQHPDWFGKDKNCNPSTNAHLVFNTSNPDAVRYLLQNVLNYIKQHPEIDILDFWPPDGAIWDECDEFKKLGSPLDRQACLINQIDSAVKKIRPELILEMIAYQPVLLPSIEVKLNEHILVDFCPYKQSYEKQIYDPASLVNAEYVNALKKWRTTYSGDIGLYSYYRKYAWNSLPVIIPSYMQRDIAWYSAIPLQGVSTYAEPGDWFSYELNLYFLGKLSWDSQLKSDSILDDYCKVRFGEYHKDAKAIFKDLEDIVPQFCSLPYTSLKAKDEIVNAKNEIQGKVKILKRLINRSKNGLVLPSLKRLLLMLEYTTYDLQIQELKAARAPENMLLQKINEMIRFLTTNKGLGIFIVKNNFNTKELMRRYSRTY